MPPNRRDILPFCIIAFGLAWIWWSIRLVPLMVTGGLPIDRAQLSPFDVPAGMLAPMVAAMVLLVSSGAGLRGSFQWKRPIKVYALSFLVPAAIGLFAIWLLHITRLGRFQWAGDNLFTLFLKMMPITILAFLTAIGEEYGWRGYLLPRLLPLGDIKASFWVGLIWGLWHLPVLLAGLTYPDVSIWFAVPVFLTSTILLSFLFTWIYHLSSGSILAVAVAHGTLNAMSELTSPLHMPDAYPLLSSPFGLVTSLLLLALIASYYAADRWKLMSSTS